MFADAYEMASQFTQPVVLSLRFFDKAIDCRLASFVVLNPEGWILTVAHLFQPYFAFQQHAQEMDAYNKQVATIEQDNQMSTKQKKKKISQVKSNPKWITKYSYWWGRDAVNIGGVTAFPEADVAIAQLQPFDPQSVSTYPTLKDPATVRLGTSLCRLGFPLYQIKATFDEQTDSFKFAPGALPVPRFPIEGIATRHVTTGKSKDGKHKVKFLETSSPGLKGQSGGPILDAKGTVWAIQSRTVTIPTGFSAKIKKKDGKEVEENQLISVGHGVHPEVLVTFLNENGIKFQMSDY